MLKNSVRRNLFLSLPAFVIFPHLLGLVLSIAILLGLNYLIPLIQKLDQAKNVEMSKESVSEFIELFLLGTNAGLNKLETLNLIVETSDNEIRSMASKVVARCNLGISLFTSLTYVAEQFPNLRSTIRILSRSESTGGPIIEALELELMLNRAQASNEVLQRVRSLSVKCVLPLGLCFLPAFFLLTIVPIVFSLLPNIFSTFH